MALQTDTDCLGHALCSSEMRCVVASLTNLPVHSLLSLVSQRIMQALRLAAVAGQSGSDKLSIIEIEKGNNNRAKYDKILAVVDLLVVAQGFGRQFYCSHGASKRMQH